MALKKTDQDELLRCPLCDSFFKKAEGFTCPRCRQGPFCKAHHFTGRRECTGCVFDMKQREVSELHRQEKSICDFMKLLQFIFLLFAIFFIATRTGVLEFVNFLKENPFVDNIAYFGILPAAGYVLFYVILYNQRNRIKETETEMRSMEFKRMVR